MGETEDLTFISNVIRDSRAPEAQRAGIRIGASVRRIACKRNVIEECGTQTIVDESQSRSNRVQASPAE